MFRLICLISVLVLSAGCAMQSGYRYDGPPNVTFIKTVDKDKLMTTTGAFIFVNRPNADCSAYSEVGMNVFKQESMDMAFPSGEVFFINVAVLKSEVNKTSIVRNLTLFKPEDGYHYKFDVFYKDGNYDFAIYEKSSLSNQYRQINPVPWSEEACKKMKL